MDNIVWIETLFFFEQNLGVQVRRYFWLLLSNTGRQNFSENVMTRSVGSDRNGCQRGPTVWLNHFYGYVLPGPKCSIFVSTVIPGNFSTMAEIRQN